MRYRKLDANGDYSFGHQQNDFYINVPAAPGQAALTRLTLFYAEWFLDTSDGTKWYQNVFGAHTQSTRDLELRQRVNTTPGVSSLVRYSSSFNTGRKFNVSMTINTVYGQTQTQISGGGGLMPFSFSIP